MTGKPRWGHVTEHGYSAYEVTSALQKAIRRGQEDMAMHWAYELYSCGRMAILLNRLRIIGAEDIGLGDPQAVVFALHMIECAERWYKANGEWQLGVANAILALCRARKSRVADHFYWAIKARQLGGWKPPIPDEALDAHTQRGKHELKRGPRFFIEVSSKLVNPAPLEAVPDPYKAEFDAYWLKIDAEQAAGQGNGAVRAPDEPNEPERPEGA